MAGAVSRYVPGAERLQMFSLAIFSGLAFMRARAAGEVTRIR